MILALGSDIGKGESVIFDNETITMLRLARILSLIPMGLRDITPTQFQGTLNFITGALAILDHGRMLAHPSDNWKKILEKKSSCRNLTLSRNRAGPTSQRLSSVFSNSI